jgi:adenylate cyclase
MSRQSASRKLTAIFYADVAGYSRLTGEDELGTHNQVMSVLDKATETIDSNNGNVLRFAGDAILAEFSSVVAAVQAALEIQNRLHSRNKETTPDKRVQIRIGIHLGEVLQDRNEIFGDGVNIAARLETEATPGGICISAITHEQIDGKVAASFKSGGECHFHNIARPVQVYHWTPENFEVDRVAGPALPEKPSIAILAFENMSNDPDQDYFAEGISEDIITQLSKYRSFFRERSAKTSAFVILWKAVSDALGTGYELQPSWLMRLRTDTFGRKGMTGKWKISSPSRMR